MANAPIGAALVTSFVPGSLALTDLWSVNHTPAANTQATATRAAGAAGVRHVIKKLSWSIANPTALAAVFNVNVRDGASGAGTVLWSYAAIVAAGADRTFSEDGLMIIGTAATAMTIEFSAAGGSGSLEVVNAQGYDAA